MDFAKIKKKAFFLIMIRYISQKCYIFAPRFKKNSTKLQKIINLNKQFMKKVFQIVLFSDKWGIHKVLETKELFDNERTANMIAHKICKEKKLYFTLKEYYL